MEPNLVEVERSAQESEAKFRKIFLGTLEAITINSPDGRYLEVNDAWINGTGFTREKAIGKTPVELGIVSDQKSLDDFLKSVQSQGDIKNVEMRFSTKGGLSRTALLSATTMELGGELRIIFFSGDITWGKQAQDAQALLAAVVESSDDAIGSASLDGIVTSWNPAAERLYGFSAAEVVGKHLSAVLAPDRLADAIKALAWIAQGKGVYRYESHRLRKDGSTVHIGVIVSPIRSVEGMIVGASAIARNITAQKNAEAAQALLASVVESSEDAIVSTNFEGTITSWNRGAERLYGYSASEIVGKPVSAFVKPDQVPKAMKAFSSVVQGKGVYRYETRRRRKDGTPVDVSMIVSPVRDVKGAIVGVSGIARDVTERKRAERELRESETKFRKIFDQGLDSITINLLRDGRFVDVNPEFERLSGYSRSEVVGKTPMELKIWAEYGDLVAAAKELAAKGVVHNREADFRSKNGEIVTCLFSWARTEIGGQPCVITFGRDITEIKRAREILRDEHERLSAMLATQNDIAHAELDLNAVMNVVVERAQKLTRAAGAQIDMIDESELICRASSGNRVGQLGVRLDIGDGLSAASIAAGEVIRCDDAETLSCTECEPHCMDGQRSALFAPMKDAAKVIGVLKVFAPEPRFFSNRDVDALQLMAGFAAGAIGHAADFEAKRALLAERTAALSALQESEERFRKVFEQGHIGMCVLCSNGNFVSVNEAFCRMLGYSRKELERLTLADVTHPDDVGNNSRLFQKLVAGEISRYKLEKRDIGKGGKTVWVSVSASAIRDRNGNVYVLGIIEDINERVLSAQELAESRRALIQQERLRAIGELASGVAHAFNNTLNAMRLRLAILGADPKCQERHATDLATLNRIVQDASETIGRLQDFAQQRRDRPPESVDLARLIREAIDMAHSSVEERSSLFGASIRVDAVVPDLPPVVGSPAELRQVFVNLLLNASDAMREGGAIRIDAEARDGTAIVKVADQGIGIPEEHLDRIFEPFFTTKGQKGSGLGLSIAYNMMTRLGGSISAANRPEGGAVFTLTLPLSASPPNGTTAVQPPVGIPSRRILVVDDDIDNLNAIQSLLELKGHKVEASLSGTAAIGRFHAGESYEIVLCDLGMPDMNGWETAQAIGELAPTTEVYILTGWAQKIPEHDPRRKLVKDILAKPIDVQRIDRILANMNGAPGTG